MRMMARLQRAFCLPLVGLSFISLQAQTALQTTAPQPAIINAIDQHNLVTLKGSVHPLAKPGADRGVAPDSLQIGKTILLLKRSPAQQAALDALIAEQQNSKSSSYHKWIKPSQFGAQYGAAEQDIQTIDAWLQSFGLQVEPEEPGRNMVIFSGTHAQLKAAFGTELHSYQIDGKSYWANASDPKVPAALAPVIAGFASLNNFPKRALHTQPKAVRREAGAWKATVNSASVKPNDTTSLNGGTFYALAPADLAAIYNLTPLWNAGIDGTGQTIAIVGDSDFNTADVDYFRSVFGLPPAKLNVIRVGESVYPDQDEGEVDLDVEWAGAVARNATIDAVLSGNTPTTAGIDTAAIYIISNNLASILNVSYGSCELALGTGGNQFYSEIWEQAAAQGITVVAAAGDSGSASCDQGNDYSQYGLQVSGISSTPYNVSIGGTDLYGTYQNPTQYWNATNDPTTYESALSYIPELPWNNGCGNPQLLSALQTLGLTDTTSEMLCNDPGEQYPYLSVQGGSGGASRCATVDATSGACLSGYPKPAWQAGVQGVAADGARDLPDVSFMAGNGLWGSFYIYCQSDASPTQACDVDNEIQGAGGTSFAAPVFSGVMALVQQKTSSEQGMPNYTLYKMAQTQFTGSGASACLSENVTAGNNCVFYDVDNGSNSVPCLAGTPNCTPSDSSDQFGLLPGYAANPGYDSATGIGSINIANLVNGWSSVASTFLSTSTTLSAQTTTAVYGTAVNLDITVAPASSSTSTPSGDVGIISNSPTPGNIAVTAATLSNGKTSTAVTFLPGGSYQLFARYNGDINFASSQSAGATVSITPAPVKGLAIVSSQSTVQPNTNASLSVTIPGLSGGTAPSGTVTFTDTTSGATLGIAPVLAVDGASVSVAVLTATRAQLVSGSNSIAAVYSGDGNYGSSNASAISIVAVSPFVVSINPTSLTFAAGSSGSVAVTATPIGSSTLNPANLTFSCPSDLSVDLGCSFSAPVIGANGTVVSTLSFHPISPLAKAESSVASTAEPHAPRLLSASLAGLAGFLLLGIRRRRSAVSILGCLLIASLALAAGCQGGSSGSQIQPSLIQTTTRLSTAAASPAWNAPLTLTAQVTPGSGAGTPTGTVTFYSGTTSLGTSAVSAGAATFTTTALPAGTQSVTASYGGDAVFASSTSTGSSVDVVFAKTIAVTASDNEGDSNSANLSLTIQ